MSLPPATVQIKRKATDEPVDFLRVHETNSKRQRRTAEFVFSRQYTLSTSSSQAPQAVRRIKQLPRGSRLPSLGPNPTQSITQGGQDGLQESNGLAGQIAPPADTTPITSTSQTPKNPSDMRRFHLSRDSPSLPSRIPVLGGLRVQKRSAVFVERRSRPSSSQGATPAKPPEESTPKLASEISRPQKKPGRAARIPASSAPDSPATLTPAAPVKDARMPSDLKGRWDFTSEELAAEMQSYTLQQIGLNLARSKAEDTMITDAPIHRKAPPSRFKPKAPSLRYQQRHPEEFVSDASNMDVDDPMVYDEELDEDSDYIIETYIRMPAHEVEGDNEKRFGLLVLDSQPDIDEFYREESDHEEQENDEEEDENAEDHYTADYPDDEVDSDDEYDRNAYNYRNHNASDQEEFDENDEAFSDDEGDGTRYPWDKKQTVPKPISEHSDDEGY